VGHDALSTKAQQLQDGPLTGLVFVKTGAVYGTTALGFLAFDLIADGEDTPVLSGSTSRSSKITASANCEPS
jgi:hypothetical protein